MKRLVFLLLSTISAMASVKAQTFTQYLQQTQAGKGNVTISQSRDIDALVNGSNKQGMAVTEAQKQTIKKNTYTTAKANVPVTTTKPNVPVATEKTVKAKQDATPSAVGNAAKNDSLEKARAREQQERLKAQKEKQNAVDEALELQRRIAEKTAEDKRKEAEEKRQLAETKRQMTERSSSAEEEAEAELHIPTVDMRKKVMRGARKVTGYRVQAFAGGNTRADKTKAQQAGNDIKMRFPDQPIYVHFYSPRWICRVGNYRSINEARQMLNAIKGMGYKSAVIVKGQITVFD